MTNFQTRFLSGLVYIALLCFGILYHELSAHILFLSLSLLALREYRAISKKTLDTPRYVISFLIGLHVYFYFNLDFATTHLHGLRLTEEALLFSGALLLYLEIILMLVKHKTEASKHILISFFSYFYTVLPFALAVPFAKLSGVYDGFSLLLVLIFIWASDTFAYLVGRQFGKHKLFEAVSPKKTWEGFIGGGILTIILGLLIAFLTDKSYLILGLLAMLTFLFGSVGDLIQSAFKRTVNIKDSSNLIPGHGGILDRLDSFIFAVPILFIAFKFLYQTLSDFNF
ncbi:MAG: phosphatidate cytidylyltransferase [Flavobacteriales bacterium]